MPVRLIIIAVTPSIAIAIAIYLTDRYDREPLSLLIKVFIFGALSVIPALLVQKLLIKTNIFTGLFAIAYTAFIIAGLSEEYFKRIVVLYLAYKHKDFNEKLDGIVYCGFSALGFATVENIMYVVFRFSNNYYVGILRGVSSVPAHVLFAVTMGYYLSLAKFTGEEARRKHYLLKSLLGPTFLHGIFNFILMAKIPVLLLLFIPYTIYLWRINLIRLNKYTKYSRDDFNRIIGGKK